MRLNSFRLRRRRYRVLRWARDVCGAVTLAAALSCAATTAASAATPQPTTSACGELPMGQQLTTGQSLISCDGRFDLTLQTNGNLVLYQGSTPLWASGTAGRGAARVAMQYDGNLVIYSASGQALWSPGIHSCCGIFWLSVQNDGNLVIDAVPLPLPYTLLTLWSTGTHGH